MVDHLFHSGRARAKDSKSVLIVLHGAVGEREYDNIQVNIGKKFYKEKIIIIFKILSKFYLNENKSKIQSFFKEKNHIRLNLLIGSFWSGGFEND